MDRSCYFFPAFLQNGVLKKISTTLLVLLTAYTGGHAQAPNITWQKTIGGAGFDGIGLIHPTADSGYVLAGTSNSDSSGDKTENSHGQNDYWIVKLAADGKITWQKTIGGSANEQLKSIIQTTDDGYLLGGYSWSDSSGNKTENSKGFQDFWVVKLNAAGTIEWQKTIGGSSFDELISIAQTSDGGYLLGGHSESGISGDKTEDSKGSWDFWVIKLKANGTIDWQKTIGGNNVDYLSTVVLTSDGSYLIGGASWSGISGDKTEDSRGGSDFWVIKLNASGTIDWQKTIGGDLTDNLTSIIETSDGSYLLGGLSESTVSGDKKEASKGSFDYWVIKLNASGTLDWQKTIGGDLADNLLSIALAADGGYLLGGQSTSNSSGDKTTDSKGDFDYWILKLNASGIIEWQKTIGGSKGDHFGSITPISEESYVLGGESYSDISGDKTENSKGNSDYWILRLDPPYLSRTENDFETTFSIYPNPATSIINLKTQNPLNSVTVFSTLGALVKQLTNMNKPITSLDVSSLESGVYFLQLISNGKVITRKFIKE